MTLPVSPTATGPKKLAAVKDIMRKLAEDAKDVSLLPAERIKILEELKIYGRDVRDADPIFTKEGIETLLKHAFYSPSADTARAAQRVLANAMLLKPDTRQVFVDLGYAQHATSSLKTESWDDEFLLSRILFLTTYNTTVDLKDLIEHHQLADMLIANLNRHVKLVDSKAKNVSDPMEEMALVETLKLLFNVTYHCKDNLAWFTPVIFPVVTLLWKKDIPSIKPMEPPFGQLVHAMLNLNLGADKSQAALFPKTEPSRVTLRLLNLLGQSMQGYGDDELEVSVTPIVSLVAKIHQHAPDAVKKTMREAILPTAEDREKILGRGTTLPSRLLKNSTNPVAPALRDAISHMLFDMSDKDASTFVQNIGYGFASGFLFQNNVPIPASAAEAYSTSDNAGATQPVNPITGQFVNREKFPEVPAMSEEEKMREAEKMFVLFERLKQNGMFNVQNPIEAAVQSGRFDELDDEVEELD